VVATDVTPAPVKSVIRLKAPPPPPDVAPVASVNPVPQAKVPKPVAPVAAVAVPRAQRASSVRTITGAAAVIVVIAAIGFPLATLWLGGQESSLIIREAPPAVKSPEEPARAATPPGVPAPAATTAREESVVQAPAVRPAPPKPAPVAPASSKAGAASSNTPRTAAARVPPRTGRQPVAPVRQAAAVAVPSPVVPAPAPEVAAPAPVAAAPAPEPPPAPVGPFFELRDVNETPRVATRVEPQVPDELRDRPLNEVVIVRVLVTQAGHPLMVNLLRKSKSGPSLDDAIVAAVKQWTFVPARKRGEAVSCWFHVGVPVSRAN
jgi:protein TonB